MTPLPKKEPLCFLPIKVILNLVKLSWLQARIFLKVIQIGSLLILLKILAVICIGVIFRSSRFQPNSIPPNSIFINIFLLIGQTVLILSIRNLPSFLTIDSQQTRLNSSHANISYAVF